MITTLVFAAGLAATGIKLYPTFPATVTELCDLHEKLVIARFDDRFALAYIKEDLTEPAACDTAPESFGKSYRLNAPTTDECGSVYWTGASSSFGDASRRDSIAIADHRKRRCDDLAPVVEVTETLQDGSERTLLGNLEASFSWP